MLRENSMWRYVDMEINEVGSYANGVSFEITGNFGGDNLELIRK